MSRQSIDNEIFGCLQQIAIKNVLSDDFEFYVEKCYRYYSKTYCTPLHEVKSKLTPHEVILTKMEDDFMEAQEDKLIEIAQEAMHPIYVIPINIAEPKSLSDEEWIALENKKIQDAEMKAAQQAEIIKKTQDAISKLDKNLSSLIEEGSSDFNIKE